LTQVTPLPSAKHGFKIVDERRNLYGQGRDRYIMELEVDPDKSASEQPLT
jgi:hypothetical protein